MTERYDVTQLPMSHALQHSIWEITEGSYMNNEVHNETALSLAVTGNCLSDIIQMEITQQSWINTQHRT